MSWTTVIGLGIVAAIGVWLWRSGRKAQQASDLRRMRNAARDADAIRRDVDDMDDDALDDELRG